MRRFLRRGGWNIKIVFLMRDPINRHWSYVRHASRNSGEVPAFTAASLTDEGAVLVGRYDLIVPRLKEVFAPKELIFAFYEDIFSNDDTHLRRLSAEMNVKFVPQEKQRRVNAGPVNVSSLSQADIDKGKVVFEPVYAYIAKMFPSRLPTDWHF
jgi:hypothetical protein